MLQPTTRKIHCNCVLICGLRLVDCSRAARVALFKQNNRTHTRRQRRAYACIYNAHPRPLARWQCLFNDAFDASPNNEQRHKQLRAMCIQHCGEAPLVVAGAPGRGEWG